MKIYSRKLPQHEVDHLIRMLKKHEKENLNPNISHFFVYEGVSISVYKSNVVLFQGHYIDYVVDILLQKKGHQLTQLILDVSEISEKATESDQVEIGCSQVGASDYFGGIVTAAVIVNPDQRSELQTEMVRDTKVINDQKIGEVYERISPRIKFHYTSTSASEYNELFEQFKNDQVVKTYLHNKTLAELIQNYELDQANIHVIMDQFVSVKKYSEYLSTINPPEQITINVFEPRAESKHLSVALASLVARYYFLKQIDEIHAKVDMPIFLGSTNPQIKIIARQIHEKFGASEFRNFIKFHFKTTDAIVRKKQPKR